jgi:Resolvase, N terminal domain
MAMRAGLGDGNHLISAGLVARPGIRRFVGQKLHDKPCRNEALCGNPSGEVFRTCWSAICASRPTATGSRDDRAGLGKALAFIRAGDCLVVWKLDRLGRSLPHLLTTVAGLKERAIAFRSLTEQIDTTTPQGELLCRRGSRPRAVAVVVAAAPLSSVPRNSVR